MTAAATEPVQRPLTVRPAPRREPPFDDELPVPALRAVGPHDQPLPFEHWNSASERHLVWAAPQPTGRGDLPEPAAWARRLLVAVFEARAGRRPVQQLSAQLSVAVLNGLSGEAERRRGKTGPPVAIRSVHTDEPADGVAEIAAVIQVGNRYRAVAARLEGLDGRWRCVRLQIG